MMKKNKLYTANKWNQPMFMSKDKNIFLPGGQFDLSSAARNYFDGSSAKRTFDMNLGTSMEQQYLDSKNAFGISKANNPFSKVNMQGVGKAVGNAALSAGAGLVGSIGSGLISGGLQSAAGSAISNIGGTVAGAIGTVNPVAGAIVGVGSQLLGGLANRAFGSKLNQENINAANNKINEINQQGNIMSSSQTNEDVLNNWGNADLAFGFDKSFIGEDGWFSDDAESKYNDLKRQLENSKKAAIQGLATGVHNADINQDNDVLYNYTAFGGPLNGNKKGNKMNRMTQIPVFMNNFALGGDVQMHGSDFTTGLTRINAGGSHEENPNDGVQMGVDMEGTPNLVEEGETVWNDYVFSNRILADDATKQMFKLPKKKDVTFADISKKLEKEISERPNDPISKAGFEAQMQTLEEQQERQKSEMEAERARAAFEALSPEEQTAVMQNAAQQEAIAQQAAEEQAIAEQQAMQQPSPEEVAMMQQQADGTQANLGQQAPMMAEGGKVNRFDWGGLKELFSKSDSTFSNSKGAGRLPWNIKRTKDEVSALEAEDNYKRWTQYVNDNWDSPEVQDYLKTLDLRAGGNHLYMPNGSAVDVEKAKKYWNDARTDGKWGYYHYTPTWTDPATEETVTVDSPEARIHHAMDGDDYDGYIEGELDPNVVGAETRREVLPNGDTVIYHGRTKAPAATSTVASETTETSPRHRSEWLRYAGLFGPAVGLGMQALGIGKPDYSRLDAAVERIGNAHLADYKPLGNYLTYRPMDIWFEQNRMDANARATDRAIMNSTSPSRMAGLLANGYNSQLASGDLYRKALEYNDAKRERVAAFNRGTDQFNAEAYNRNSQFNADALNRNRQYRAGLAMQAARDRMAGDAGWYNSLYGNVAGLFKGIGDLGTENYRMNRISDMAADGIFGNLGDSYTGRKHVKNAAKGGKLNKKKKGLTF